MLYCLYALRQSVDESYGADQSHGEFLFFRDVMKCDEMWCDVMQTAARETTTRPDCGTEEHREFGRWR